MIKTYLKKENGITLAVLVITIIVILILARVTIAMIASKGEITKQSKKIKNDLQLKQLEEQVHKNLDYKYYYIFGEELEKSDSLVEEIAKISLETGIPTDVFTIYYKDYLVDANDKGIYYRLDLLNKFCGENEDEINKRKAELHLKEVGPFRGDGNCDGILTEEDIDLVSKYINENKNVNVDCDVNNDGNINSTDKTGIKHEIEKIKEKRKED